MDQYNFTGGAKYHLLPGSIQPYLGAMLGYTYRVYTDIDGRRHARGDSDTASTDAFDAGGMLGVDFKITDNFALGADFRYVTNLDYKSNSNVLNDAYRYSNPLERED